MSVDINIPKGWVETTLGDLVERITKGTTPKIFSSDKDDINYIKSDALQYGGFLDSVRFVKISEKTNSELKRSQLKIDDILLSMAGEKLGKTGLVKQEHLPANTNQAVAIVTVNKKMANHKYIWYKLRNNNTVKYFKSIPSQSAQPNINFQEIRSLPINLPPLSEQKAIAKILTAFDNKIELLQAQNNTLETPAQTIFKEWFGKYQIGDELPEGWRVGKLGNITKIAGGTTPSTKIPEYWGGTIHWTSPKDLSNSKEMFLLTTEKKITTEGLKKISSGLLPIGTLLLSSRAPVGYLSLTTFELAINQGYIAVLPEQYFSNCYMYLWLNLNMKTIKSAANGSTFLEISKSSFRNIDCIIPGEDFLRKFDEIITPIFDKTLSNLIQIQILKKTRDTLLPKLMSGALRVDEYKGNIV